VIVKVPRNPCRTGCFPPIHHLRRAFPLPVLSPPTEAVVAPDVAARSPYRWEMRLEVGGISIRELGRFPHDSSRYAAPRRSGSEKPVGLAGASGTATGGIQSGGLQVPAGD
jgi:hypothetical protein